LFCGHLLTCFPARQFALLRQAQTTSLNQVLGFDVGQNSEFGVGDNFDSNVGENTPDETLYPYN
jgi:hypothetical protein